jgi:hypothetical protein
MDQIETKPAENIKNAYDSVGVINEVIAAGVFNDEALDKLKRNSEHLELISSKPYAVDFASDVAVFAEAIANANNKLVPGTLTT